MFVKRIEDLVVESYYGIFMDFKNFVMINVFLWGCNMKRVVLVILDKDLKIFDDVWRYMKIFIINLLKKIIWVKIEIKRLIFDGFF